MLPDAWPKWESFCSDFLESHFKRFNSQFSYIRINCIFFYHFMIKLFIGFIPRFQLICWLEIMINFPKKSASRNQQVCWCWSFDIKLRILKYKKMSPEKGRTLALQQCSQSGLFSFELLTKLLGVWCKQETWVMYLIIG